MSSSPRSKQQFVITRDAAVSAEQIFEVLMSPASMKLWVPLCRAATWRHPPGRAMPAVGSVRVFHFAAGVIAAERIVALETGHQLNYCFEPPAPLNAITRHYEGQTRIDSTGPHSSRVSWAIHFDAPGVLGLLEPALRAGLKVFVGLLLNRLIRCAEASPLLLDGRNPGSG